MISQRLKFIPNLLTIVRLALCPLILFLVVKSKISLAMELFALACATDYLDGFFARRLDARTPLGEILDPISDKIFTLAFFTLLMTLGTCPSWFLGLLITVTIFQGAGLLVVKVSRADAAFSLGALSIGKWNTTLQFIWIAISLIDKLAIHRSAESSVALRLVSQFGYLGLATMQIAVFFQYFYRYQSEIAPHFRLSARPA